MRRDGVKGSDGRLTQYRQSGGQTRCGARPDHASADHETPRSSRRAAAAHEIPLHIQGHFCLIPHNATIEEHPQHSPSPHQWATDQETMVRVVPIRIGNASGVPHLKRQNVPKVAKRQGHQTAISRARDPPSRDPGCSHPVLPGAGGPRGRTPLLRRQPCLDLLLQPRCRTWPGSRRPRPRCQLCGRARAARVPLRAP